MDAEKIEYLLQKLGCSKVKRASNGWINATCPLARWKHPKGTDEHPSFGVSIEVGNVSRYRCHGCNSGGELPFLLWSVAKCSHQDLSALMSFVQANNAPSEANLKARAERIDGGEGYWRTKTIEIGGMQVSPYIGGKVSLDLQLPVLPETDLQAFQALPENVLEYLTGPRRLTVETIQQWELGWHEAANRVVIPVRDLNGSLVGISGRAFTEGQRPKYLHSSGFRRDFYVYGEFFAKPKTKVYLCEGFFDVIYLQQRGYNAVAMLGSHLSHFQVDKIKELFTQVAIVPDGDQPGIDAAAKALYMLKSALPTTICPIPMGKDPDELSDEELISSLGPPSS